MLRRFFNKLQQEEKLYKDRISDLQGAMNPDAENTTMQRYKQAKLRLQAELKEQLIVRMETLDQAHSSLEYARERSEMCAVESKLVLTHAALLAGDYDAQLSGVYGDIGSSGEQDSELIPLLKQLIAMLESGGPFLLSSELLNLIKQASGGAGGQHVTNINLGDGRHGKDGRGRGDGEDSGADRDKRTKSQLVKSWHQNSRNIRHPTRRQFIRRSKGQRSRRSSHQSYPGPCLKSRHYEAAKLEHDLKKSEIDDMNKTVDGCEKEKEQGLEDAKSS
ncbi:hypothetical protein FSP39_010678 [Pinctada imbricata]|uniref:Uncharacterized protein n=1 Tax=Pinctada imbricata TaxID=66713 RepID=A0AA89BHW9_PINIB|nr:hypothetical protein FSP39_010678 [Pinctada imbricata]